MSVTLSDITVRYGKRIAVDRVSLQARAGEVTALVGPNGSGKTTLLKAVAGLTRHEGRIDAPQRTGRDRAIGYMPQDTASHAALTVFEAVLLGRYRKLGLSVSEADARMASEALESLGIQRLASRYLGELSGGQRQLAFLAQALASQPQVLLLDEPISALDIHHQLHVLETIQRLTVTRNLVTIVVLHDLSAAARHADRLAVMRSGQIAGIGAPADVLTEDMLRRAFQVEASVARGADGKTLVTALRRVPDREQAA